MARGVGEENRFRGRGSLVVLAVLALVLGVLGPVGADSFADDDGGFYEPALDALAESGILDGTECGEGLACPDEEMERWVMAVWLVRALEEADPEGVSSTRFEDVDTDQWWMPFVERLAELGVTRGCAVEPARFCPEASVTRAQMATFLTRAFSLESAPAAGFVDTEGNTHEANINALAGANFTAGCATEPARFCPGSPVTRGQMATFLARALGLVPLPAAVDETGPRIAFARYAEDSEILLVDVESRSQQVLTDKTIRSRNGAWSPDGTRIAFESKGELFVVDTDGANLQLLTNSRSDDSRPLWSPDGTRIAFLREGDVFVVDANGANLRQLTHNEPSQRSGADVAVWSPDGTRIVYTPHNGGESDSEIAVVDADGTNQQLLTDNSFEDANPVWSPDGTRIAFDRRDVGGTRDIYVMMADGSNPQPLAVGSDPDWSPDGSRIAFKSGWKIFVMMADGSNLQPVARGESPLWSPDGSRIAFISSREGFGEVHVMDVDSNNIQQVTDNFYPLIPGFAWSPDGSRIAFTGGYISEIFVMGGDGSNQRRLTYNNYLGFDWVWSPDGTRIAFMGHLGLDAIDVDGGGQGQVIYDGYALEPAWSPDGTRIAFEGYWFDRDIFVVDAADGTNVQLIIHSGYDDAHPAWSPDGAHIAFEGSRDGTSEVFVVGADGSNLRQITDSDYSWVDNLVWSPDGSRIAFTSSWRIFVVDPDDGKPKDLTKGGEPAWSPDSSRIAFSQYITGLGYEIFVMDADGTNRQRLTYNSRSASEPAWSPDGSYIAFTSYRDGDGEIYLMRPDGSDVRQLTDNNYHDKNPVWSPAAG